MNCIEALAIQEDILSMTQEIQLPLADGGVYTWCVAKPQLVLQHLAAQCPSLLRTLERTPNSIEEPWGIVHYHDDVTAGHLLSPSHSRSFTAFRFTFKQFGNHLRSCQEMWIEYAFLRTAVCEKVVGGMSFIFRILMHLFFTGDNSFKDVGVYIEGIPKLIFAVNECLIADGKAQSITYDFKGSNPIAVCQRCTNVVKKGCLSGAAALPNPTGKLVEIQNCTTLRKCEANTNDAIFAHADELHDMKARVDAKQIYKYVFEMAEIACGIKYNPRGMLFDKVLRPFCGPLDILRCDWAHIYLCKGIGGNELWALLGRAKACGITYRDFRKELPKWSCPRNMRSHMVDAEGIFSEQRFHSHKDADCWKSTAGEFLFVYPIVNFFVRTRLSTVLPDEVQSFAKLCSVLDFILSLKRGSITSSRVDVLRKDISEHFELHLRCYGDKFVTPKWHDALHLPDQYRRDGCVYDTLCNERYHQMSKAFAEKKRSYFRTFDQYLIARSIAQQTLRLQAFNELPHLEKEVWDEDLECNISGKLTYHGIYVSQGDFVIGRGEVIQVLAIGRQDGRYCLIGHAAQVELGCSSIF